MRTNFSRVMFVATLTMFLHVPALAAASYRLTTLLSFDGVNGANPFRGLIADADGNLYGTTYYGGAYDNGTVFRFDPETQALATLVSFDGAKGAEPDAGLITDADGNLYGTTRVGGTYNHGTVFRIDPDTQTLTTLVSFDGANGEDPRAGLVADADGNLYGTTRVGGPFNQGTVFRLDPNTQALATLVSFDTVNGIYPLAGLVANADGSLYGTTGASGTGGYGGTVFRLDPDTQDLTTLVSFDGANGAYPFAGLVADGDGNLYGTTSSGGAYYSGTVFRLDPDTQDLTTVVSFEFDGADGRWPYSDVVFDADGYLYGTTRFGGESNYGTVFRLDPETRALTTLVSFDLTNGAYPFASLVVDANGNLYGTTSFGGAHTSYGTVFRLSPVVPEQSSIALATIVSAAAAIARRRR